MSRASKAGLRGKWVGLRKLQKQGKQKKKNKNQPTDTNSPRGDVRLFYWRRRCRDARSSVAQAWSANFGHDDSQIWRLRHNIRDPSTCFVPPPDGRAAMKLFRKDDLCTKKDQDKGIQYEEPPDGGWGWLVVLHCFLVMWRPTPVSRFHI